MTTDPVTPVRPPRLGKIAFLCGAVPVALSCLCAPLVFMMDSQELYESMGGDSLVITLGRMLVAVELAAVGFGLASIRRKESESYFAYLGVVLGSGPLLVIVLVALMGLLAK